MIWNKMIYVFCIVVFLYGLVCIGMGLYVVNVDFPSAIKICLFGSAYVLVSGYFLFKKKNNKK